MRATSGRGGPERVRAPEYRGDPNRRAVGAGERSADEEKPRMITVGAFK
jgi:hypothetical protein